MYSPTVWQEWLKQQLGNYSLSKDGKKKYLKKGYLHLDSRIWLPDKHSEIEELIQNSLLSLNPLTKKKEFYAFSPFLKILTKVPRYRYQFEEGHYDLETKIRPICYAAHKDSLILSYYSFALTKQYEQYIKCKGFDDAVLAYRSDLGKCNIQFAKETFDEVKRKKSCSAIALDIKGYFDHIDHKILLAKWQKIIDGKLPEDQYRLFKIITNYSYINQKSLLRKYKGPKKRTEEPISFLMEIIPGADLKEKYKRLKFDQLIVSNGVENKKIGQIRGIPQGSPISALLSNIYLIDFDYDLNQKAIKEGFSYRRYCDDILIICDTDKAIALMDFIINKISKEYLLKIQYEKVDIIDFHKNSKGNIRAFKRPRKTRYKVGEKPKTNILENPAKTNAANEDKYYRSLQYLGFEFNGKDIFIRPSSLSRFFRKLNYRLQRTVVMSYAPKSEGSQIFLRQIYERYSHLGERNFLTYAYNAAKQMYEGKDGRPMIGLDSVAVRKQLRNHLRILRHELQRKNIKWSSHKLKGKKKVGVNFFK